MPAPQPATQFAPDAKFDSAYFFMVPDWRRTGGTGASVGRRRVPVVVVIQPELSAGKSICAVAKRRLSNVELLPIENESASRLRQRLRNSAASEKS